MGKGKSEMQNVKSQKQLNKNNTMLQCNMCSEVFRKKSKNHFKCPRCGAHFTQPVKEKGDKCK